MFGSNFAVCFHNNEIPEPKDRSSYELEILDKKS